MLTSFPVTDGGVDADLPQERGGVVHLFSHGFIRNRSGGAGSPRGPCRSLADAARRAIVCAAENERHDQAATQRTPAGQHGAQRQRGHHRAGVVGR